MPTMTESLTQDSALAVSQEFTRKSKLEFQAAILELRLHREYGHMAEFMYEGPEFEGDRVNGAGLWTAYLDKVQDRSSVAANLARAGSDILPQYVTEPVALAFLGMGDVVRFRQNDLTLTSHFRDAIAASAFDSSAVFLADAIMELQNHDNLKSRSGHQLDIFKGFEITRNGYTGRNLTKVATTFGRTLFNLPGPIGAGFPQSTFISRVKAIKRAVGRGGLLAVEYSVGPLDEAGYEPQDAFAKNLAERINRDAPSEHHVNIDDVAIRFEYHTMEDCGVMGHYITLGGPQWGTEEYHYNSTWTCTDDKLAALMRSAGFISVFDDDAPLPAPITKTRKKEHKSALREGHSRLGLFMGT